MINAKAISALEKAMDSKVTKATRPTTARMLAEVLYVDTDGTIWVHIFGGTAKTPVSKSAVNVKPGDSVTVVIENNRATIEGNLTAPAIGEEKVDKIIEPVVKQVAEIVTGTNHAVEISEAAKVVAEEAAAIANSTNQHFWHRSEDPDSDTAGTGAFVTDEEQETFLAAIKSDTEPTTERPLHNLLMNAEGILLRAAKKIRAAFTPSGVAFYDGEGNESSNIVALFGKDGSRIGNSSGLNTFTSKNGFYIKAQENDVGAFTYAPGEEITFPTGPGTAFGFASALSGGVDVLTITNGKSNSGNTEFLRMPTTIASFGTADCGGVAWNGGFDGGFWINTESGVYFGDTEAIFVHKGKDVLHVKYGDQYGSSVRLGAGGLTIIGGGEFANNFYDASVFLDTNEHLVLGADSNLYLFANGNTIANRKGVVLNTSGDLVFLQQDSAIRFIDSALNEYTAIKDNGYSLWIGAGQTASTHHFGATYISSGYDGSNGNPTIYISVPNSANSNATNYGVYHTGNKPALTDLSGTLAISHGGTGATSKANARTNLGLARSSTTTIADVLTAASNFTISNVTCLYTDIWAQIRTAIKTTDALTANTNYSIATIKAAYKPYMGTAGGMYSGTNATVYVDANAVIHFVPRAAISAGSTLYISIPMYFLA